MHRIAFTQQAFDLLRQLTAHNEREWYHEHKQELTHELFEPFEQMLLYVTDELQRHPFALQGSKKTMFRLNRDVRFSKDKTPYKTYVSGVLSLDGTKKGNAPCAYVRLNTSGGFIASGIYGLETKHLFAVRQYILDKPKPFTTALDVLAANNLCLDYNDSLSSMPRGFNEYKEHSCAKELKLKNFSVKSETTMDEWLNGDIGDLVVEHVHATSDLLHFLQAGLHHRVETST